MLKRFVEAAVRYRFSIVVATHVALVALGYYLAFVLRLESFTLRGEQSNLYLGTFFLTLAFLVPIRLICFARFGLFHGLWRYVSVSDLVAIFKAATLGSVVFIIATFLVRGGLTDPSIAFRDFPRSVVVIEWLLTITLSGGIRFAIRVFREMFAPAVRTAGTRVGIIGAGDAGVMLLREMKTHQHLGYDPICFLDDAETLQRRKILGVPVAGTIDEMAAVAASYGLTEVVIAIPTATGDEIRRIVELADDANVRYRKLPDTGDIVRLTRIRDVEISDLLGRPPARLDIELIRADVNDRNIFVSGAAGSIGSELVRQVASYGPRKLVVFDRGENALFYLEREITEQFPDLDYEIIVGDLLDDSALERAFALASPDYVFHAAAFKHVPLMEANPEEAVKNNALGTRKLAELSVARGVEKFVLISSDKAVRPSSVMGATKRVAELVLLGMECGETQFISVRFGNVLGSRGSIVPLFQRQIQAGGPITITHPDIVRYFMTIPEAVQLVLQAGTMGEGGEIFILDMGAPVKIVDLAENLIRLSGFQPGTDIAIKFIGLRPGEKLFEELLVEGEGVQPTKHDQIRVLRGDPPPAALAGRVDALIAASFQGDREAIIRLLKAIVPEYVPQNSSYRAIVDAVEKEEADRTGVPGADASEAGGVAEG